MLKLSVFTVMLPDLTPEEAIVVLKENGYAGVEWRVAHVPPERRDEQPSFWGNNRCTFAPTAEDATRAKTITEGSGIEAVSLGTYINVGDLELTERAMQFAQTCGAPQIRVGSGKMEPGVSFHDAFKRAQNFLSDVQELAQQYQVRAVIEIHHKTLTPSASLAHRMVSHCDPEWIGVLHDAGNMVQEGFEDYRMGLELLGPYLKHVHIKNAKYTRPENGGVWQAEWSPLENGVVDWEALFRALNAVGYEGWLGMEDFSQARPTRETLQHNAEFLGDIIARLYG